MRRIWTALVTLLAASSLLGKEVTLPAAASIVGAAPFFTDVRVFNTSYMVTVSVTATYRCFLGSCPTSAPTVTFSLLPRESLAFDDIVAAAFHAPDSAGGVEFVSSGVEDDIVVTSRLYSTFPTPTVGMFVPGLERDAAHANAALTSIRNGGPGGGFRVNVGAFNGEDEPVTVTFRVIEAGAQVGVPVTRVVPGHSGVQVNGIYGPNGSGASIATQNGVVAVEATGEVFSFAAVIDNTTTDPIFIVGAEDSPFQPTTPRATTTPTAPESTATPTRTPTPTPTPAPQTAIVNVGQNGNRFVDQVSGTSTTTITRGTTVDWVWVTSVPHSVTATDGSFDSGVDNAPFRFSRTFSQTGSFRYFCTVHGNSMSGTVIVNP